jgi:hypothetical protein
MKEEHPENKKATDREKRRKGNKRDCVVILSILKIRS